MSMSEVRRKFQNQIREGIDQDVIDGKGILRVRQSLLMYKYRSVPQTENKGDKSESVR